MENHINQQELDILVDMPIDPLKIANYFGVSEGEIWEYIDRRDNYFKKVEKEYKEVEWPKVLKACKDMASDLPPSEVREMRRRYLVEKIRVLRESGKDPKRLERALFEAKMFLGEVKEVSEEQIRIARAYPLENLLKSRNGVAKCPFHNDKTPSMDVRKNFYHCYGCGAHGDVIDFVMKTRGVSFTKAVEALS